MTTQLSDLTIDEISIVDDPANGEARVVIFKAKAGDFTPCDGCKTPDLCKAKAACMADKAGSRMTKANDQHGQAAPDGASGEQLKELQMDLETLSKALEDAEAKMGQLEKRTVDAESALSDANEVIKAKDAEIADLKKSATPAEDDVMKSLPEPIRKRLEEAETQIAKMRDEADLKDAIAKARELGVGKPEEVGPLLLRVSKGMTTAEDAKTIESMLKSQAEVEKKSTLFKSVGTTAAADGEPEQVLKAKAEEIHKANKGMTFEQAYAKAVDENPAVYAEYINKRRA